MSADKSGPAVTLPLDFSRQNHHFPRSMKIQLAHLSAGGPVGGGIARKKG